MSEAREEVLRRIRSALGDRDPGRPHAGEAAFDYRRTEDVPRQELVERFLERVAEYRATVHHVTEEELPAAIADACRRREARRMVVPTDWPAPWRPDGVELLADEGGRLSPADLDASDGVMTGCALAVAQTGTIILDGRELQGRRVLTLVPDYHLCIVRAEQVVALVPEAVERIGSAVRDARRPLTWISGPSATSDIELSRVEGVHGPRSLEVILVG